MTKFYAYDPDTGATTDITGPVSTDGLNLRPPLTPETAVTLHDQEGNVLGTYAIKRLPYSVHEVQEILNRGGKIWP